ncbi:MAG: histidine triad nucleotide-binding protein [Chloroflexi bacterium HGW-Chloroflexi-4]|jgi:histidine triad (HIT) family protein|nr:MAG: histidine triad nucleotide-binding protein [Chloroflexi bacterium HGW-Chloroflexi-4]
MTNCIFCDIIAKTAPAEILYEDEQCVVIKTIQPLTPIHLLILPRIHYSSLNDFTDSDSELAGHMLLIAKLMASRMNISDSGYRVAINVGAGAGQTVFHLHLHVLGGRPMGAGLMTERLG